MNHKGNWLYIFKINFGWTKTNLLEQDLNFNPEVAGSKSRSGKKIFVHPKFIFYVFY